MSTDTTQTTEAAETTNGVHITREQAHARDRAAFLAEADDEVEAKPAPKKEPAKVEKKAPAQAKPVDDDDDLDLDDDEPEEVAAASDDEEDSELDDVLDEDEDTDETADSETQKRIAHVRRTEQKMRADFKRKEDALEREKEAFIAEWKPIVEEARQFVDLKKRVKYQAADVLMELGVSEDDLGHIAKEIFARSKEGAADPKNREQAARHAEWRETKDRLATLEKELAERRAADSTRAQQAEVERTLDVFFDGMAKLASGEDTPLARIALSKKPRATRAELETVAARLGQKLGQMPTQRQVLRVYEKQERRRLEALGVDPATVIKTAPAAPVKPGDKTKAGTAAGTKPAQKAKPRDLRDEIIADLEGGNLDLS